MSFGEKVPRYMIAVHVVTMLKWDKRTPLTRRLKIAEEVLQKLKCQEILTRTGDSNAR